MITAHLNLLQNAIPGFYRMPKVLVSIIIPHLSLLQSVSYFFTRLDFSVEYSSISSFLRLSLAVSWTDSHVLWHLILFVRKDKKKLCSLKSKVLCNVCLLQSILCELHKIFINIPWIMNGSLHEFLKLWYGIILKKKFCK
jgi:hypothetical protein